jgi:hypothetical protein
MAQRSGRQSDLGWHKGSCRIFLAKAKHFPSGIALRSTKAGWFSPAKTGATTDTTFLPVAPAFLQPRRPELALLRPVSKHYPRPLATVSYPGITGRLCSTSSTYNI